MQINMHFLQERRIFNLCRNLLKRLLAIVFCARTKKLNVQILTGTVLVVVVNASVLQVYLLKCICRLYLK